MVGMCRGDVLLRLTTRDGNSLGQISKGGRPAPAAHHGEEVWPKLFFKTCHGEARCGVSRMGEARLGRYGMAGLVEDRCGMLWHGRRGKDGFGLAGHGAVRQGRRCHPLGDANGEPNIGRQHTRRAIWPRFRNR